MSVGGITGLNYQENYTIAQQLDQVKKNQIGLFESKQLQGRNLADKIQGVSQVYQQKGSIFQIETTKSSIYQDGYAGKLTEQKWAQKNYDFESNNVKRLNQQSSTMKSAASEGLNKLKDYMEQAQITTAESKQLDEDINTAGKEVDANKAVLQAEENSRAEENRAKADYDYAESKSSNVKSNINNLQSKKTSAANNKGHWQAKKTQAKSTISFLTTKKASIGNEISALMDRLSELQSKSSSSNTNNNVAIDTQDTIQQNNGAEATIAETQNANNVSTNESTETTGQTVQENTNQDIINDQIENEIQSILAEIDSKKAEEKQVDKEIESQQDIVDKAEEKENEFDSQLADLDEEISARQKDLDENETIVKEKKAAYEKASEVHNKDYDARKEAENKILSLKGQIEKMTDKKGHNDKKLEQLKKAAEYFSLLYEGTDKVKFGTSAELETAEKKETNTYNVLQQKNTAVVASKITVDSQSDVASKAKGDFSSVQIEMDAYRNIFANINKAE